MPRTAIVVDSACNLPPQYRQDHHIYRVPVTLSIDGVTYLDSMQDAETLRLCRNRRLGARRRVTTQGPSLGTFEQILSRLEGNGYEHCLIQTASAAFSDSYTAARGAVRARATLGQSTSAHVLDSATVFSGQALLAALTARLLENGTNGDFQQQKIEQARQGLVSYLVPSAPATSLARLQLRGERAMSWVDAYLGVPLGRYPVLRVSGEEVSVMAHVRGYRAAVAYLLRTVAQDVEAGRVDGPTLCLQQAGTLDGLLASRSCERLQEVARAQGKVLLTGVASLAAALYSGAGSTFLSVQEAV